MSEGIELPNQGKIRTLGERETYKYLEILEADTIKQEKKGNPKRETEFLLIASQNNAIRTLCQSKNRQDTTK